jgi:hypothetical protein
MFQSNSENNSSRNSSGRVGKLAFVVGDPAETRTASPRANVDISRQPSAEEDNKWLIDRLMACYND